MQHKIATLTGTDLDAAVAKAEGKTVTRDEHGLIYAKKHFYSNEPTCWAPSRFWEQGGPIIEQRQMSVWKYDGNHDGAALWHACAGPVHGWDDGSIVGAGAEFTGPTALIAAMRCRVASQFGDTVDL